MKSIGHWSPETLGCTPDPEDTGLNAIAAGTLAHLLVSTPRTGPDFVRYRQQSTLHLRASNDSLEVV